MRRSRLCLRTALWLSLLPLLASGCGSRSRPAPPSPTDEPPPAPTSVELGGSVIRTADPAGSWQFEARSEHVQAKGVTGPYELAPADCRYQREGGPVVLMRADRATVDKPAGLVTLTGSVRITSEGWTLEADHVRYQLATGEVVAPGRTKLTFSDVPAEARPPSAQQGR